MAPKCFVTGIIDIIAYGKGLKTASRARPTFARRKYGDTTEIGNAARAAIRYPLTYGLTLSSFANELVKQLN